MPTRIDFDYPIDSTTTWDAWNEIKDWLAAIYGSGRYYLNDKPAAFDAIESILKKSRIRVATIGKDQRDNDIASLGVNTSLDVFGVAVKQPAPPSTLGYTVPAGLLNIRLIYGIAYDVEYDRWQNVTDIESYEYSQRPHEHLPKKPNGLPPPLSGLEIDISRNPGRRLLCNGYVEAVGALMWIGPVFAERTGGDWTNLKAYDWCRIQEQGDIVRIQSWDHPFDSDEGEQRKRQEILRKVLFPRPCDSDDE